MDTPVGWTGASTRGKTVNSIYYLRICLVVPIKWCVGGKKGKIPKGKKVKTLTERHHTITIFSTLWRFPSPSNPVAEASNLILLPYLFAFQFTSGGLSIELLFFVILLLLMLTDWCCGASSATGILGSDFFIAQVRKLSFMFAEN